MFKLEFKLNQLCLSVQECPFEVGDRTRDLRVSRTALYRLSFMVKLGTIEGKN